MAGDETKGAGRGHTRAPKEQLENKERERLGEDTHLRARNSDLSGALGYIYAHHTPLIQNQF